MMGAGNAGWAQAAVRLRAMSAWTWAKAHPSAVLLYTQLLGILLYPFLEGPGDEVGTLVLSVFGMLVMALALAVVRATPSLTWVAVLIGVPAVVLTFVDVFTDAPSWHLTSDIFHAVFYAYTFVALLRYMFEDEQVTTDELYAIGATFTIGIWLFAYVYSICQSLVPGSFTAALDPGAPRTWFELLFLSCTTMTSTGLSDVVPIKPHARSLVMIQQIAGMLYLAIVVARVVGLTLNRRRAREADQSLSPKL